MDHRFDTNRSDFEPYGLSVTRWQPTPMNRTDRHNEIELNCVLTEPVIFQIGGRRTYRGLPCDALHTTADGGPDQ